jgi:hypothetical protein
MEIQRTNLAMVAKCKCGAVLVATMLHGGVAIEADIMDDIATTYLAGGTVEIINADIAHIVMGGCSC